MMESIGDDSVFVCEDRFIGGKRSVQKVWFFPRDGKVLQLQGRSPETFRNGSWSRLPIKNLELEAKCFSASRPETKTCLAKARVALRALIHKTSLHKLSER